MYAPPVHFWQTATANLVGSRVGVIKIALKLVSYGREQAPEKKTNRPQEQLHMYVGDTERASRAARLGQHGFLSFKSRARTSMPWEDRPNIIVSFRAVQQGFSRGPLRKTKTLSTATSSSARGAQKQKQAIYNMMQHGAAE